MNTIEFCKKNRRESQYTLKYAKYVPINVSKIYLYTKTIQNNDKTTKTNELPL